MSAGSRSLLYERGQLRPGRQQHPDVFIQDGIKFPDLIDATKPEPDREIPQAQTAHDTFWDFSYLDTQGA